jgi:hypothetical protein
MVRPFLPRSPGKTGALRLPLIEEVSMTYLHFKIGESVLRLRQNEEFIQPTRLRIRNATM